MEHYGNKASMSSPNAFRLPPRPSHPELLENHSLEPVGVGVVGLEREGRVAVGEGLRVVPDVVIGLRPPEEAEEIEGMYSKIQWNFIDDIIVTENNIFINLISAQTLNIPKRAFNNEDEQKNFLKYIDEKLA